MTMQTVFIVPYIPNKMSVDEHFLKRGAASYSYV